jgi:hypothetical protein
VTRMLPLYVSIVTLPSAARGSVFETVRSATAGGDDRRRVRVSLKEVFHEDLYTKERIRRKMVLPEGPGGGAE